MSMSNHEELFAAICDDRATDQQRVALTELLRTSAEARDDYLRYVDLHAALAEELVPAVESSIIDYRAGETAFSDSTRPAASESVQQHPTRGFSLWAAVAVSLLVGALGTWAIVSQKNQPTARAAGSANPSPTAKTPTVSAVGSPLATLAWTRDCSWKNREILEGQRLPNGTYELMSGSAMLRMTGGAEVVMTGSSRIELFSAGSAKLHFGNTVVRASDDAQGFTLWTPNSEVVDLGTEFAVKVSAAGDTQVHVLDGLVEFRRQQMPRPAPKLMKAGDAINAATDTKTTVAIELDPRRFEEIVGDSTADGESWRPTVHEPFDYPVGVVAMEDGDRGEGWAGPWRLRLPDERRNRERLRDDESAELKIVPDPKSQRPALLMPAGFSCFVRQLDEPIKMDRDGITYLSLRLTRNTDSEIETRIAPGMRLTLRSSEDYFGRWICGGLDEHDQPYIQTGGGVGAKAPAAVRPDEPMIWVIKVVSDHEFRDSVYFRILESDDRPSATEPASWNLVATDLDLKLPLDRLLLSVNGPNSYLVDDVRIGPTWRSVVGQ